MTKTKYITVEELQNDLLSIIDEVYEHGVEYIVMENQLAKVKISVAVGKNGKKVFVSEQVSREQIKKFLD